MITVQNEYFAPCIPDLEPLFERAYQEFGRMQAGLPLSMDYPRYIAAEEAGLLFLTTMRKDGALVGYMTTTITSGMHHSLNRIAVMDIMFVDKAVRGRGHIFKMLDFVEAYLRDAGVSVWISHYVVGNSAGFERVLERLGFSPTEQNVAKWIGPDGD